MSVTAWNGPGPCKCGDPREPGSDWCVSCGRRDAVDKRSQAREAAKHIESSRRRGGRGISPAASRASGATPSTEGSA
jgi:hypothetical protein